MANILSFKIILLCFVWSFLDACEDASHQTGSYCTGNGWIQFNDEKCFKLISKMTTRDEAKTICGNDFNPNSDPYRPTLATIKTAKEQEFLAEYIFETSQIDVNVWIGAKRNSSNQFQWDDGKPLEFTNWVSDSPTEESKRSCVEIKSEYTRKLTNGSELDLENQSGKWHDVTCNVHNLVVCEKLPKWSLAKIHETILLERKQNGQTREKLEAAESKLEKTTNQLEVTKNQLESTNSDLSNTKNQLEVTKNQLESTNSDLSNTKNQLLSTQTQLDSTRNDLSVTKGQLDSTNSDLTNTKNQLDEVRKNPVPSQFIYVQLPDQQPPQTIWSNVAWEEVTSQYAGLFFRAEGGGSAAFGQEQGDNSPRVTSIAFNNQAQCCEWEHTDIVLDGWSTGTGSFSGSWTGYGAHSQRFYTSGGEVRPRNKAMKIWKRV